MSNRFKVGDKVVVARMPIHSSFTNQKSSAAYLQALIDRTIFTIKSFNTVGVGQVGMCLTDPEVDPGYFTCLDCLELESAMLQVPAAPCPTAPSAPSPWAIAQPVPAPPMPMAPPPAAPYLGAPVPQQEEQVAVFVADADKPYPKGMPESERKRIEAKLAARRFIRGY